MLQIHLTLQRDSTNNTQRHLGQIDLPRDVDLEGGNVMNDMPERLPSQPSAQAIARNAPTTKRPPPTSVILPLAA